MDCPSCGNTNPAGARFCFACGEALPATDDAGGPIVTQADAGPDPRSFTPDHLAEKIQAARDEIEGERKQVTVLFADVVGSMDLTENTDPEAWQRIMGRFFSIMCDGVHRFEGTVDKFTGDGMMAIFGAPIAHEDHARRACFAALHLQRELAAYATELRREESLSLSVRMGLNSGEVVVGSIGSDLGMEYTAIGHTVGLGQRMEQLAEPGKIYLTDATAALAQGYFALVDLGEFQVKGASDPTKVHELTGVGEARARLDVSRARGFSRFVGREEEMEMLESALEHGFAGQPQVVGIVGEPGVGKSRLCDEFTRRCTAKGVPIYHASGHAHTQSVPLLPVLELMRDYFDVSEVESGQTARERIAGKLLLLDESFSGDLPLLFDFLGVPDPDRPSISMDPEARQRHVLGLIKRLTRAQSARQPGVSLFEDLHWLDSATEAFLANHVETVQGTRSLTIVNYRPGYHAPWMSKSYYRQIALAPLGDEAIEELLAFLLGTDQSLASLSAQIKERTGGNPFFVEEVVQSLVEDGSLEGERGSYRLVPPAEAAVAPANVQAVLSARIDRLTEREKNVLQTAAVIGKEFSEPVLEQVVELDSSVLQEVLVALVATEFIYEQELFPEAVYAFKHPLTQEVAYGSQLGGRRAIVHAAVARTLADHRRERLDENAALLAQHWEAAGEALEAARWHARAAAWSGFGDPTASLQHWRRVRELADGLPRSEETTALGINARIFALQYGWRLGITGAEAEELFRETESMASSVGDLRSRATMLMAYGIIRGSGDGDAREFARLVRESVALAEETADPALHMSLSFGTYGLSIVGEYRAAIGQLDRALELAEGDTTLGAGVAVGCPYAYCLIFKGGFLAPLGEWRSAGHLLEAGMKLAGEQKDVETVGWGHMWSCFLCFLRGESDAAVGHAQQALEIAEGIGGAFSRAWAWQWFGAALQTREKWTEAIEALEKGRAISQEGRTGVEIEPLYLGMLADSLLGRGDLKAARAKAESGVRIVRERGARGFEMTPVLALARVLLASESREADAAAKTTLFDLLGLVREIEARGWEPIIRTELAEVARRSGDEEARDRELREAERLYTEMSGTSQTERVEGKPAPAR